MLTYGDDKKREAFRAAIERAREAGIPPAEMVSMITAIDNNIPPTNGVHPDEPEEPKYEPADLPEHLISLPSLIKDHGVSRSTLNTRIRAGKLRVQGKVKAPAPGGGYKVVSRVRYLA